MINWSDVNSLQKQKSDKEIELKSLLSLGNVSQDQINELQSEILYLKKQIEKIVGINEIRRQKELRLKKSGVEQKKLKNYYILKDRYNKIGKTNWSVKRFITVIDKYHENSILNQNNEMIRIKI